MAYLDIMYIITELWKGNVFLIIFIDTSNDNT